MFSFQDITSDIIRSAFRIHNSLGPGYLEHVYRNALALELKKLGRTVRIEVRLTVEHDGTPVGICKADLIVEEVVAVETKAQEALLPGHVTQLRAYLRSSPWETGLVLNFGPVRVEVKRVEETKLGRRSG
ncbi:MAG: GxxExxY protein [Planctomycetes bacterium]|nr:GxxExxY protein [Planctomycetota bacterium]